MLSRILSAASESVCAWVWPQANGTTRAGNAAPAAGEGASLSRRIADLEKQAERQAREAREAGFREGEAAGRDQATVQVQPVLENLARSIADIVALRPLLMRQAEADLVELALGIARRILRRELSVDPGALEGLIKGALERLPSQEISRIRLHPELEAGVRRALAREGRDGLSLIPDGTLERGAVIVETTRGKLDASLESQLAEIGRGLADRIGDR